MISYCIAVYRPVYARLLIADLVRKTSPGVPFEILLWINVADAGFDAFLSDGETAGWPLRIIGRTPHNIGMRAYRDLFQASRFPLIVQIDDDVVCVSRGIAEHATSVFAKHADVRQIVADVWQDDLTTGARPPMTQYACVDATDGLYDGPIDGWFSIYHRSILPLLLSLPFRQYCCLGATMRARLAQQHVRGVLCTRMTVFHVIGPAYASLFSMREFEVDKYRRLGRTDIVQWYQRETLPARSLLESRFAAITASLER